MHFLSRAGATTNLWSVPGFSSSAVYEGLIGLVQPFGRQAMDGWQTGALLRSIERPWPKNAAGNRAAILRGQETGSGVVSGTTEVSGDGAFHTPHDQCIIREVQVGWKARRPFRNTTFSYERTQHVDRSTTGRDACPSRSKHPADALRHLSDSAWLPLRPDGADEEDLGSERQ